MGLKRYRATGMKVLSSLLLFAGTAAASDSSAQRLAVVVPAHAGDLSRAVSALDRWPRECSPVTKDNVDLVLYYAEGEDDSGPTAALDEITTSAGRCFSNTRLVYANLNEEEDVYPRGPSVQFYKMFLDEGVKAELERYDALAIIEWDVLVASDRSFAELYRAAFSNSEDFWVKGSNLEGTNFHTVAESSEMWHVMGHINGNAIYNNNDPVFTEFVEYTLARWEYKYPYDVALWATISDFPYSWPLWQHYSSKFVTTNLISNVGYEHVDSKTVSDAVAGKTLFIHGSSVDNGNLAVLQATSSASPDEEEQDTLCEPACDAGDDNAALLPPGASTMCDPTCYDGTGGRFGGYLCGAGNSDWFGPMCRICYTDAAEARKAESHLAPGLHVVMCDTGRPPAAIDCSDECGLKKDTVCDAACGTGLHGDYNCNWRGLGDKCRFCFDDVETALSADEVAKRHGGRVIMCDTHEPPMATVDNDDLVTLTATSRRRLTDEEPRWRQTQKWKSLKKWQTNQKWKKNRCDEGCVRTSFNGKKGRVCDSTCNGGDPYGRLGCGAKNNKYGRYCRTCFNDVALAMEADTPEHRAIMCDTVKPVTAYGHRQLSAPDATRSLTADDSKTVPKWQEKQRWKKLNKWQTNQKWKKNRCDEGCVRTSFNGKKGRVCDSTCNGGDPYGRLGCGAKNNKYGRYCRTCFNDVALAMEADTPEHRAIMCDTVKPVSAYGGRKLVAVDAGSEDSEDSEDEAAGETDFDAFMRRAADQAFTKDTKRGEICAFIEGRADQVLQTDVTVQSILEFLPGLRVAVAVEPESLALYESTIGFYTGVRVSSTPDVHLSPLFADQHCGEGTKLILYMQGGSVLSRTFTSKDTHTPRGELLVVYGSARQSYRDAQIAHETAAVLGFDAPSFTYGTDLILPVGANAELRFELSDGEEDVVALSREFGRLTSVPQLLAALAYSRDTEGVHFVDPQTWVTQNLFKFSSIWDIPLMKPRFACALPNPAPSTLEDDAARAEVLERSLRFFRMGGACENGLVSL